MKKCLIVSGGEYSPFGGDEFYDLVIACDRGYLNCKKAGMVPNVVIGDMDSYTGKLEGGFKLIRLNPIKDDTDTLSAVKYALESGCKDITICCALGGRLDHTLANIQTMAYILERNASVRIRGSETEIYGIKNSSLCITRKEGYALSVFSLSDKSIGVSISGTKYLLSDAVLTNDCPIGVSNEWGDNEAVITVKEGMLLVLVSYKKEIECV